MSNLQKIVVLCVVVAVIGGGFFLLKDFNYEKPQSELKIRDVESDDVDVQIQFKGGGIDNNEPPIVIVDEPESTGFGVGNDPPVVGITPEEESGGTSLPPTADPQDLSDFE